MTRIRLAIVIDNLRVGGAQKLVASLASAAAARGIDPTIISLRKDNDPIISDLIKAAGVRIVKFPSRSLFGLKRLWRLIRYFRKEKFNLIHTHLTYANILGCVVGYLLRIPVIATLHNVTNDPDDALPALKRLEGLILRLFAQRILAVGYTVANSNSSLISRRALEIVPNGIPVPAIFSPDIRQSIRREIAGDETRPILISVGRFVEQKGHTDLIEAFELFHHHNPRPILILVGAGSLFDQIKTKISDKKLDDSIRCLGKRSDVPQLLAASDIFVSASYWEGLPVAILEAMMVGLPVVATSVGDNPYVVTPETGIIVPPHEPARLADALHDLVSVPEKTRAMGKAAQLRAMQEYSLDVWMNRLSSLYEETLSLSGG